MTIVLVPYHQEVRLAADDIPVQAGVTVEPRIPDGGDAWSAVAAVCEATATAVAAADGVPVVFSGDCLVAGGVVAGAQRSGADPGIVWFDAHGDVHTLETSTSGYLGGVSLRVVTGAHADLYADRFGLRPLAPERAVLVDARDLDPAEADYLAGSATGHVTVADVGPATVPAGPLVLHVDVDVVDAGEVPGLRFPAADGPSTDAVLAACGRVLATGRVVAVSVACPWWPTADDTGRRIRARLVDQLVELLAKTAPGS